MRSSFGETRSRVRRSHALICPDSHEKIVLPHWPGTTIVTYVAPALGSKFSLFGVTALEHTWIAAPLHSGIRFVLVRNGSAHLLMDGQSRTLPQDAFAYLPPNGDHHLHLEAGTELLCLERCYQATPAYETPGAFVSAIGDTARDALNGNTGVQVRKLLPSTPAFDMEINVMEFAPGMSLPYVETHFMEHGLMMLDGGGIYRLDENWYPVTAGDVIWMAPFCPQWFAALGQTNARYLIYKNWNRDPL